MPERKLRHRVGRKKTHQVDVTWEGEITYKHGGGRGGCYFSCRNRPVWHFFSLSVAVSENVVDPASAEC